MASRHMLSLCCSRDPSGSMLLSMLQSEPSPLPSPFTRTTSQWLLDASVPQEDSDAAGSTDSGSSASTTSASTSAGCAPSRVSASGFGAPSRFSLLLESRCLLPNWGKRSRPGLRLLLFGLPEGLLVRLREGADLRLAVGDAIRERWVSLT